MVEAKYSAATFNYTNICKGSSQWRKESFSDLTAYSTALRDFYPGPGQGSRSHVAPC